MHAVNIFEILPLILMTFYIVAIGIDNEISKYLKNSQQNKIFYSGVRCNLVVTYKCTCSVIKFNWSCSICIISVSPDVRIRLSLCISKVGLHLCGLKSLWFFIESRKTANISSSLNCQIFFERVNKAKWKVKVPDLWCFATAFSGKIRGRTHIFLVIMII